MKHKKPPNIKQILSAGHFRIVGSVWWKTIIQKPLNLEKGENEIEFCVKTYFSVH